MTLPDDQLNNFEAAKTIFEKIKDFPKDRQERILKWVAEELGILNFAPVQAAHPFSHINSETPRSIEGLEHTLAKTTSDIRSFIASKNPKSDQQFATAVAYYYRFESPETERRDFINAEFVQEATRLAGRKRLTNPLSTLNNAKGQGYLDSNSPGEFSINTVGENLVAMALPGSGTISTSNRKAKAASNKAIQKKSIKRNSKT